MFLDGTVEYLTSVLDGTVDCFTPRSLVDISDPYEDLEDFSLHS